MLRTKYAAWMAALLGCANGSEVSTSLQNNEKAAAPARGEMTTPAAGAGAAPTLEAQPTATASDKPSVAASDKPVSTTNATASEKSAGIDPTGVWWTEVMTVGSEVLPILDKLDGTNIRFVMRVEVTGAAPNNNVKFEFCQLQTEWIDPMDPNNITTIGFRPETVAAFSESATVDLGNLTPGAKVPLPSLIFRGGIDESGKDFDDDGDGNPAVTAWVKTLVGLEIEVYETIKISATLDLTVPDENTLSGTVDFGADALIITSNNVIIGAGTVVTITPDSKTVPVTAKRLPAGSDCSALPSTIKFTPVPPAPPPLLPPEPAP